MMSVVSSSVMRAALAVCLLAACSKESAPQKLEQPLAPAAVTAPAPIAKPDKEPPRPAKLQHVTLKALGMYCEDSCPTKVRAALAKHTEIYEMGFDLSNEAIFISYDASLGAPKQVTKPMLASIKTLAGFDPWLSKEEWPADAKVQVVLR